MSVRPRLSPGTLDLGDVKTSIENVVDENVELYDRTYKTVIENFTKPLTPAEMAQIVNTLTTEALGQIVVEDPEQARRLLASARQGMEEG